MVAFQRQGWDQARIAAKLGLSIGTVGRLLSARNVDVHEGLVKHAVQAAVRHLDRLDYVTEEALEAWRQSKERRSVVGRTAEDTGALGGTSQRTESIVQGGSGDPAYLAAARAAMAEQRQMLGIGAPKQGDGPDRGDDYDIDLSDEESPASDPPAQPGIGRPA